ncbi:MAG TPA: ribosome maturation factor RimM [Solirubrobacteraceae bacterium]|jgi:16S rRNA processing protein RimM
MADGPGASAGRAPESLEAGRVGRPHGLDGSFYVTAARPRLLALGTTVTIDGQSREILRLAGVEQRPIVRVRGVEDRTAAEALRGLELRVSFAEAPALEPGEWWAHELEGCEVRSGKRRVGVVRALRGLPSCEVLEVDLLTGGELLVPMVKDAVLGVDIAARLIEVDLDFLGEAAGGAEVAEVGEAGRAEPGEG